jgi:hypothetical protein
MQRFQLPLFLLLVSFIPIAMVAYSFLTGRAPAKTEWVRRSERPREFYFLIALFSGAAAVLLYGGILLLLHPRH